MKSSPKEETIHLLEERLRGHHLEAMMTLAIVTGMRRDELRQLTWAEIDLATHELRVLNSKTRRDVRLIHASEACTSLLKQHLLRQIEMRSEAGTVWSPHDLVFPDQTGELLSPERFVEAWSALLKQAGISSLRFHALRVRVWHRLLEEQKSMQNGPLERNKNTDEC